MTSHHPVTERPVSDARLRAQLFYMLLAITVLAIVGAHLLQWRLTYVASPRNSVSSPCRTAPLRFGSYGFYLTEYPAKAPDRLSIAVLGNSVYQYCGIVERMQDFANAETQNIDFVNLAQVSSGIHDHLLQLALIARYKPDLLVVGFINHAFTPDFNKPDTLPKFRTDCDQMAFDPDMFMVLPGSFYRRNFTHDTASRSLISSVVPIRRLDWYLRIALGSGLLAQMPKWYRNSFPLPDLNLVRDWMRRTAVAPVASGIQCRFYPDAEQTLREFVTLARKYGIPVLFIRQESGPFYATPDALPMVERVCADIGGARTIDLRPMFVAADFPDQVHPSPNARDAYARRHYKAVQSIIASGITQRTK